MGWFSMPLLFIDQGWKLKDVEGAQERHRRTKPMLRKRGDQKEKSTL